MNHFWSLVILGLATGCWSYPSNALCRDVEIPVSISETRFVINTALQNDWDAVSLTFNLTRRDSGSPSNPLPIAGTTSEAIRSDFTIGALLCGNGGTVLVLTHGILESKL